MKSNSRSSGIELLRILCMIAIVGYHYVIWGGFEKFSTYTFGAPVFFLQVLSLPGRFSCSIFAIISGYYLSGHEIGGWKHYRKTVLIASQMIFYYLCILLIILAFKLIPLSRNDILRSVFSPVYGTWFAVNYLLLLLIAPFLNKFTLKLSKKDFNILLGILFVIWSIIPTFFRPTKYTTGNFDYGSLDFFIVMYLIGSYIRRFVTEKTNYKNRRNLLYALGLYLLLVLSVIAIDHIALKVKPAWIDRATVFSQYSSPISIGIAVFSVLFFLNLKFQDRTINTISSTTFGIYLIHNNSLMKRLLWLKIYPNAETIASPYLQAFIKIAAVFIICGMIDWIRIRTVDKLFRNTCMRRLDQFAKDQGL